MEMSPGGVAPGLKLETYDLIKQEIDSMANAAKKRVATGQAKRGVVVEYRGLAAKLRGELDRLDVTARAGPNSFKPEGGAYAQARKIFEEGMPVVSEAEKGIVGQVAKLEANRTLNAAKILFSTELSSPEHVARARQLYARAGKTEEWNGLVRAYLQHTFESIPESSTGAVTNLGGTFFRAVYGKPLQQKIMTEALRDMPDVGQNMIWLMQVLQATGRAMKGESITAFAQAGQKEMARESKPLIASGVETVELWRSPSRFSQYISDIALGRYAKRMAELFTSPDGMAKLRELRKLSPTSRKAIVGVSQLLTGEGVNQGKGLLQSTPTPGSQPWVKAPAAEIGATQ